VNRQSAWSQLHESTVHKDLDDCDEVRRHAALVVVCYRDQVSVGRLIT
jgi:hypothetical protein